MELVEGEWFIWLRWEGEGRGGGLFSVLFAGCDALYVFLVCGLCCMYICRVNNMKIELWIAHGSEEGFSFFFNMLMSVFLVGRLTLS